MEKTTVFFVTLFMLVSTCTFALLSLLSDVSDQLIQAQKLLGVLQHNGQGYDGPATYSKGDFMDSEQPSDWDTLANEINERKREKRRALKDPEERVSMRKSPKVRRKHINKMIRLEIDTGVGRSKHYAEPSLVGPWYYPNTFDSADKTLEIEFHENKTEVETTEPGNYFIFVHITFGPQASDCERTGFEIRINSLGQARSISKTDALNLAFDCPSFLASRSASLVAPLRRGDRLSVKLLYPATVLSEKAYTYWGLVQLS